MDKRPAEDLSPPLLPHRPPLVVDGHVDLPYFMMRRDSGDTLATLHHGPFTLEKAREAGVRLFITALYCEDRYNGENAFSRFQEVLRFTKDRFHGVHCLEKAEDWEALEEGAGLWGTFFLLENADALAGRPDFVQELKGRGIHAVGLTHMGRNRLGDGNAVLESDGLTSRGIEIVRLLKENRIMIDVAHLHSTCLRQLFDFHEGPLITSHTGIRSVHNIPRNIDLDQAREILARDGMIGITLNPEMLSPKERVGLEEVFEHLDTVVQAYGPDGVGIGSDFCGFDAPEGELSDVTALSNLMEILSRHGYGREAIHKILGMNWVRLFENRIFAP
jgi:membrane dipeptidase